MFYLHQPLLLVCIYKSSFTDQILLHSVVVTSRLSVHSFSNSPRDLVWETTHSSLLIVEPDLICSCTQRDTQVPTPWAVGDEKPARALLFARRSSFMITPSFISPFFGRLPSRFSSSPNLSSLFPNLNVIVFLLVCYSISMSSVNHHVHWEKHFRESEKMILLRFPGASPCFAFIWCNTVLRCLPTLTLCLLWGATLVLKEPWHKDTSH